MRACGAPTCLGPRFTSNISERRRNRATRRTACSSPCRTGPGNSRSSPASAASSRTRSWRASGALRAISPNWSNSTSACVKNRSGCSCMRAHWSERRRATAVDLHDGMGQHLVSLAMTLNAAASRAPPEVRLLLGEATHTVREVQSITQKVIADLSPPGLYELGLEPALKWLSVYMRG